MASDGAHALWITDRGATELLNKESHGESRYRPPRPRFETVSAPTSKRPRLSLPNSLGPDPNHL
jgi:hypothetical protein